MDRWTYGCGQIEDTGGKHLESINKTLSAYLTGSLVKIFILPLLLLSVTGCSQHDISEATLAQLASDPVRYNGKEITVEGFYFQGFEVQVLAEKLEYSGYTEGHLVPEGKMIWIEGGIPQNIYDELYKQEMMGPEERFGKIRLGGKFEYGQEYGHLGSYNSQIIPSKVELLEWSPKAIAPVIEFSQEESQQIAEAFVKSSPTFVFDGIEETLELAETYPPTVTLSGWQFVFEFDSRHAGYGDRIGQVLAQVITPHQAVIVVEQGKVTHAVIDEKWDMLQQKMVEGQMPPPPAGVPAAPNDSIVTAEVLDVINVGGDIPWELVVEVQNSEDVPGFNNATKSMVGETITVKTGEDVSTLEKGQTITAHVRLVGDERSHFFEASDIK